MSTATDSLTVVATVPEEVTAAAIVALLSEHDIKAIATGGTTAGFRAEAPGQVQILVSVSDHAHATAIIDQQRHESGRREPQDVDEPEAETFEASSHILQSRFWRYFVIAIVILILFGLLTDSATIVFDLISRIVT